MAYKIECIIILVFILYQIYHSLKVRGEIVLFRNIFTNRLEVKNGYILKSDLVQKVDVLAKILLEENEGELFGNEVDDTMVKISIIETSGSNEIISRIKNYINAYLLNNHGAVVNFSIIKDILDREVDAKDEEITQSIPTPLYVGLAATMIGIIFGLLAMPNIDGANFTNGINALINGVKLAMISSLTGLLCTTLLSSFSYKLAKSKILKEKNEQLSYLQASLLPELLKAEDTGVSGLKASLDRFAREATKISDNVSHAAIQTGINIKSQQDTIAKIESLDMYKISETNLMLFDRLEKNMVAFNKFSDFLSLMGLISTNLQDFATRTTNINSIADHISSTLNESSQLTRFLSSHFEKIEASGLASLKAVDISDTHFRDAIEKLKEETDKRITALTSKANNDESKMTAIYNDIGEKLKTITSRHLDEFKSAYSQAVPNFEHLGLLKILPTLNTQLIESTEKIQNDSNVNANKLIDSIYQLNRSLDVLHSDLSNKSILAKLTSIESNLDKINRNRKVSQNDTNSVPPKLKPGVFSKIRTRLFGKRRDKVA